MFLGALPNVATVIIIVATIFRVVKTLRSSQLLPRLDSLQRRRANYITKLTYKICVVFLISWFPIIIFNTVTRIGGFRGTVVQTVKLFAVIISNFNYVVNPVLHFKMLRARLPGTVRLRSVTRRHSVTGERHVQTTAL